MRHSRSGASVASDDVLSVVVEHPVVDLVGQQEQAVAAGQLDQPGQHRTGVDRAGRVVGVDDHERLGALGDPGLDVGQVGVPAVGLVGQVVHRGASGQADRRGPQRVVGRRHQHLVAVVEQRLHRHDDQLGHPVAQVDVVDVKGGEARHVLVAGDDRAAGRRDAPGVGVALGVGQGGDDVPHDRVGGLEAEGARVADVELQDAVALGLEPGGVGVGRAPDLVDDVLELARLAEQAGRAGLLEGHGRPCWRVGLAGPASVAAGAAPPPEEQGRRPIRGGGRPVSRAGSRR